MRRLLFVCLLLMLPLQGVWSAVAGFDLQDLPCTACPMQAQHGASDDGATASDVGASADQAATAGCCDAECPGCHGHVLAGLISVPIVMGVAVGGGFVGRSERCASDHIPGHPLRPPAARAA